MIYTIVSSVTYELKMIKTFLSIYTFSVLVAGNFNKTLNQINQLSMRAGVITRSALLFFNETEFGMISKQLKSVLTSEKKVLELIKKTVDKDKTDNVTLQINTILESIGHLKYKKVNDTSEKIKYLKDIREILKMVYVVRDELKPRGVMTYFTLRGFLC
uniref:Uncharacterized protein n=1 Tax=Clastoptera arizonana TaxID=38151 RepID=A0A1B6DHD5_9HEMI